MWENGIFSSPKTETHWILSICISACPTYTNRKPEEKKTLKMPAHVAYMCMCAYTQYFICLYACVYTCTCIS